MIKDNAQGIYFICSSIHPSLPSSIFIPSLSTSKAAQYLRDLISLYPESEGSHFTVSSTHFHCNYLVRIILLPVEKRLSIVRFSEQLEKGNYRYTFTPDVEQLKMRHWSRRSKVNWVSSPWVNTSGSEGCVIVKENIQQGSSTPTAQEAM